MLSPNMFEVNFNFFFCKISNILLDEILQSLSEAT